MSSTNFVLFGPIKKGRHGLWLAETFSTSPLWPLNKIQRNLTGSKILTSSAKFVLFDETWQEARYQRPLQSLCFSGRSEKQNGRPGLWLAETFSTSPLNGIQQNLTGNKICQRHLSSLCFSGRSEKLRYVALGPLIYVLSRNENKGVGFGRANDIVTCYHNLSYSLNWSAVDRGTNQSPTNCKPNGDFAATSAIVMNDDCGEVQSGCCGETISK